VLVVMLGVKVGEHYFLKPNTYVVNEKLYFAKGLESMLQHVIHGGVQLFVKRKKIMQFTLIFHLFRHSRPIIEYTIMQTLQSLYFYFSNYLKHQLEFHFKLVEIMETRRLKIL
jgi:hypothetical protein